MHDREDLFLESLLKLAVEQAHPYQGGVATSLSKVPPEVQRQLVRLQDG